MPLSVVTPPDFDLFVAHFMASAKSYTRLTVSSQDETFLRCLITAYRQAERLTRKALCSQTLKLSLNNFCNEIILPRPPLVSVSAFAYLNTSGVSTSVSSSLYHVDTTRTPGRVIAAENTSWPTPSSSYPNPVQITYVAGYADLKDIPEDLIHAIFMLATYFYDNRGDVSMVTKNRLPLASSDIFRQHRINLI